MSATHTNTSAQAKPCIKKMGLALVCTAFALFGTAYADGYKNTLTLEGFTAGDTLGKIDRIGEELNYNRVINQNLYFDLNVADATHGHYDLGGDIGITTTAHRFAPFAELEYDESIDRIEHGIGRFDYDFGVSYQLTKRFSPMVGFDSIGLRNNDAMKVGAGYALTPRINFTGEFIKYLHHNGSAAIIKLGYAF